VLGRIDAVSVEEVAREASGLLSAARCLTVIGPFAPDRSFVLP